jgi:hypothetical protein
VLFQTSAENSVSIVVFQLGSDIAVVKSLGSSEIVKFPYLTVPSW